MLNTCYLPQTLGSRLSALIRTVLPVLWESNFELWGRWCCSSFFAFLMVLWHYKLRTDDQMAYGGHEGMCILPCRVFVTRSCHLEMLDTDFFPWTVSFICVLSIHTVFRLSCAIHLDFIFQTHLLPPSSFISTMIIFHPCLTLASSCEMLSTNEFNIKIAHYSNYNIEGYRIVERELVSSCTLIIRW